MSEIDINSYRPKKEGVHQEFRSSENHCTHIGLNHSKSYIRQYKVDGDVLKAGSGEQRCDFLLINDTKHKSYYIELKRPGSDIPKAIDQIENTIRLLHHAISEYEIFCRIIYYTRSHEIRESKALAWLKKRSGHAKISSRQYEEEV